MRADEAVVESDQLDPARARSGESILWNPSSLAAGYDHGWNKKAPFSGVASRMEGGRALRSMPCKSRWACAIDCDGCLLFKAGDVSVMPPEFEPQGDLLLLSSEGGLCNG